jgi:hypothetical protein
MALSLTATLSEYLDELDAIGYRVHDTMVTPGLSDDEIDLLMAPTGLTLPKDVREWWHFQNGLIDTGPFDGGILFNVFGPTSLEFARWHWSNNSAPGMWGEWRGTCFPVLCSSPYFVVVECGPVDYGSVWNYAPKDGHFGRGPDSFAEVVEEWLAIARNGAIGMDDTGDITVDYTQVPAWYDTGM